MKLYLSLLCIIMIGCSSPTDPPTVKLVPPVVITTGPIDSMLLYSDWGECTETIPEYFLGEKEWTIPYYSCGGPPTESVFYVSFTHNWIRMLTVRNRTPLFSTYHDAEIIEVKNGLVRYTDTDLLRDPCRPRISIFKLDTTDFEYFICEKTIYGTIAFTRGHLYHHN